MSGGSIQYLQESGCVALLHEAKPEEIMAELGNLNAKAEAMRYYIYNTLKKTKSLAGQESAETPDVGQTQETETE